MAIYTYLKFRRCRISLRDKYTADFYVFVRNLKIQKCAEREIFKAE